VGDLASLAVPETLTALIASRLDGLAPEDRGLVSDAAVLGQSFTLPALAAVSGIKESELEARLRPLVRRELLTVELDPRSPERGQYTFVQALIREVAYNTLTRSDRRHRHLAAARYFEALGSDELAGALAGHYLAAYRTAPEGPAADALAAQARIALRAAADRAAALGSHAQAGAFLSQALTVTTDPAEQADLLERAGGSAMAIQQFDESEGAFRRAIEIREVLAERPAMARSIAALGAALISAYRFDPAVALLEPASARFSDLASDPAVVVLDGQLARAYFLRDEYRRAVAVAERVLEAGELADLVDIVADTLVTKGSALAFLGRRYEGIALIEAGKNLAERNGLQSTVGRALNNLSSFLLEMDPRAALDAARAGLAVAGRLGVRSFNLLDNAYSAALRTGDWDWVVPKLEDALAVETDPFARSIALVDLFRMRAFRGEEAAPFEELEGLLGNDPTPVRRALVAWARANQALVAGRLDVAVAELHTYAEGWHQGAAEAATLAARVALWSRDPIAARAELALLDATGRHGRAIDTDRLTVRAGIAALEGRPTDAQAMYREARSAWHDLGLPWDEALCAIDMATLLDPSDQEVRDAGVAAREILVRLGARPFIERLDDVQARRESRDPTARSMAIDGGEVVVGHAADA